MKKKIQGDFRTKRLTTGKKKKKYEGLLID